MKETSKRRCCGNGRKRREVGFVWEILDASFWSDVLGLGLVDDDFLEAIFSN